MGDGNPFAISFDTTVWSGSMMAIVIGKAKHTGLKSKLRYSCAAITVRAHAVKTYDRYTAKESLCELEWVICVLRASAR